MNILINGGEGFIARNLTTYLRNAGYTVFAPNHQQLNVLCSDSVKYFFKTHDIDIVIHTVAKGGRRTIASNTTDCYDTLRMFENMITYTGEDKLFINFGSGAEFDTRLNINNCSEKDIFYRIPSDQYGLAKNIIAKRMFDTRFGETINLRLFNCFGFGEANQRLISSAILAAIKDTPLTVVDRAFDFFYIEDLCRLVHWCIQSNNRHFNYSDINCVYLTKYSILDIIKMVQEIVGNKNEVVCSSYGLAYTGNGQLLNSILAKHSDLSFVGLKTGIQKTYQQIKESL